MTITRRYPGMRNLTVALIAVGLVAACGSPAEPIGDSLPPAATTSTSTLVETDPASVTTTVPGERPVAYPEEGPPPDEDVMLRLSIEDALLPDDAFDPPWELQWRQLDAIGYGVGPNQTDCDEDWAYEQLLAGDGGHAMWWTDGGNANHRVFRIEDQGEVLANLMALGSLADNCPVINWSEGGRFTAELFTPDVEALIMRFDDEASGEVTWVAITLLGDLLSVLQIPLWTRADGTMIDVDLDEITVIAAEMFERLEAAGPDRSPPPPITVLETTTIPDPPTVVTAPPVLPSIPTTTVVVDPLGQLLLAEVDLPGGWSVRSIAPYSAGSSDDAFVESCPAAASLDLIDEHLEWEAEFRTLAQREAVQILGDTNDPERAMALVEQFSAVAECDLSELLPGAVGSGGAVEIPGADAAGTLFIETPDLIDTRLELGAAAIGSIVVVFTLEAEFDPETAGDQLLELMTLGVAKVVSR